MLIQQNVIVHLIHQEEHRGGRHFFRGIVEEEETAGVLVRGTWSEKLMAASGLIEKKQSDEEKRFFPWNNIESIEYVEAKAEEPLEPKEVLSDDEAFQRYYNEGKRLFLSQQFQEAKSMLEAALQYKPDNKRVLYYLEESNQKLSS